MQKVNMTRKYIFYSPYEERTIVNNGELIIDEKILRLPAWGMNFN